MSIVKYFRWKHKDAALPLPDPVGPLSKDVPTSSIIEANNEVLKAIVDQSTRKKKGPYIKVAPEYKQALTNQLFTDMASPRFLKGIKNFNT